MKRKTSVIIAVLSLLGFAFTLQLAGLNERATAAQVAANRIATPNPDRAAIRAHMEFLASDALGGRGSGTRDELIAATYIASELRRYGIAPAGDGGSYLQKASARRRRGAATPDATSPSFTYNVVGILRGSDAQLSKEAVLLSAHLDHVGVGEAVNGDQIYNGADDDASGVCAVLELARVLGARRLKPKRTVIFALFGSEEAGGAGSRHFLDHSPVPLANIVANLQFEMIGRPDPKVAARTLWLTGYERSNLGAQLARHGARLVADPHPAQNFFQRSDNYALARRGVIAHTISSFGLHSDYHQPSDDITRIDFAHMTDAIQSLFKPVRWLVNSNFKPQWAAGKQP